MSPIVYSILDEKHIKNDLVIIRPPHFENYAIQLVLNVPPMETHCFRQSPPHRAVIPSLRPLTLSSLEFLPPFEMNLEVFLQEESPDHLAYSIGSNFESHRLPFAEWGQEIEPFVFANPYRTSGLSQLLYFHERALPDLLFAEICPGDDPLMENCLLSEDIDGVIQPLECMKCFDDSSNCSLR